MIDPRGAAAAGVDWLQIRLGDPPDLDDFPAELIDRIERPTGVPYLERFHLVYDRRLSIRFHRFLADDPADPHDHPSDSWSLVVAGELIEHLDGETRYLHAGDLTYRPAERPHRLTLQTPEAWTYYVAGRVRRGWGFHTPDGWQPWTDYPDAGIYR